MTPDPAVARQVIVLGAIHSREEHGDPLAYTAILASFVPKFDPVIVMNEPMLGIDPGKMRRILGGGYENAEII